MGIADEAAEIINGISGIVAAFPMDDAISERILEEERSVRSVTQMDVVNDAYEEIMRRKYRLCVIYDNGMYRRWTKSAVIQMVSSSGEIVGTMVNDDMKEELLGRPDVIWVSSDFVLFANVRSDGTERFVMPPMEFLGFGDADTITDAVSASPSPTSDMMLKEYFGQPIGARTSTMVVGFNSS
jgi:hypothetical protein